MKITMAIQKLLGAHAPGVNVTGMQLLVMVSLACVSHVRAIQRETNVKTVFRPFMVMPRHRNVKV